jgi:hypothetical protein
MPCCQVWTFKSCSDGHGKADLELLMVLRLVVQLDLDGVDLHQLRRLLGEVLALGGLCGRVELFEQL